MSTGHLTPETIGAITDGELFPDDEALAQAHLKQCQPCALRVVEEQRLKAATSRAAKRFPLPAATLARLQAQVKQKPGVPARKFPSRPMTWGAIAAAILVALSLGGVREFHRSEDLTAELLDQHLAVLSDTASPQVLSSDRHTVKPWFQGKLPFSFNLPEPGALPPDTTLLGADLTYLDGKPAAMLLFTIHRHRVSVFVSQQDSFPAPPPRKVQAGFQIARADGAGLEFAGVSDVNRSDLEALMDLLVRVQ
jgi:anti-sigma factor RsiW